MDTPLLITVALLLVGAALLWVAARSPLRDHAFSVAPRGEQVLRTLALVCWGAGLLGGVMRSVEEPVRAGGEHAVPWIHVQASDAAVHLERVLAEANAVGRPVMLNFGAAWCAPCEALERVTFADDDVRRAARRFVAVHIDVTQPTPSLDAIAARFGVRGLPTVAFVDSRGNPLEQPRSVGFIQPAALRALFAQVP